MDQHRHDSFKMMNSADFAMLGGGKVAYVKEIGPREAQSMMPHLGHLPKGIALYSLHAADGSCMAIADSKDAVIANALEFDLNPVAVH